MLRLFLVRVEYYYRAGRVFLKFQKTVNSIVAKDNAMCYLIILRMLPFFSRCLFFFFFFF